MLKKLLFTTFFIFFLISQVVFAKVTELKSQLQFSTYNDTQIMLVSPLGKKVGFDGEEIFEEIGNKIGENIESEVYLNGKIEAIQILNIKDGEYKINLENKGNVYERAILSFFSKDQFLEKRNYFFLKKKNQINFKIENGKLVLGNNYSIVNSLRLSRDDEWKLSWQADDVNKFRIYGRKENEKAFEYIAETTNKEYVLNNSQRNYTDYTVTKVFKTAPHTESGIFPNVLGATVSVKDTDQDGIADEWEDILKIDKNKKDTDSDGLEDIDEIIKYGTDPRKEDTDEDSISDGDEILNGTNPLVKEVVQSSRSARKRRAERQEQQESQQENQQEEQEQADPQQEESSQEEVIEQKEEVPQDKREDDLENKEEKPETQEDLKKQKQKLEKEFTKELEEKKQDKQKLDKIEKKIEKKKQEILQKSHIEGGLVSPKKRKISRSNNQQANILGAGLDLMDQFDSFLTNISDTVIDWIWGTEEIKEKLDITQKISSMDGVNLDGHTRRYFNFKIADGSNVDKEKSNGQHTYILIHGYKSAPSGWIKDLADRILLNDRNAQILFVDWTHITDYTVITKDSTWVKTVSTKLADKLKKWGVNKNQTMIIGHSLGSLLGAELSKKLGKVDEFVALDPAGVFNYSIDKKGTKFSGFKNKSQYTRCFVGSASFFGNESFLKDCDESYYMDFPFTKIEHSETHKIYRDIIAGNTLYNFLISPFSNTNLPPHNKLIKKDEEGRRILINGVLNIKGYIGESILDYLNLRRGNINLFYGSESNNNFSCKSGICEFYGWWGDDNYAVNDSINDFIIKDFKERRKNRWKEVIDADQIKIESPYKVQYGILNGNTTLRVYYSKRDFRDIVLEGVSKSEVEKWLKDALDTTIPPYKKKDFPIQIE